MKRNYNGKYGYSRKWLLPFIVLFFSLCLCGNISAQQKYWVFFRDKSGTTFNPYLYFDKSAVERRENANLPLFDSTDYPLNPNYINSVAAVADSTHIQSRWLNALSVWATVDELAKINTLPFVKRTMLISGEAVACEENKKLEKPLDNKDSFLLNYQVKSMQGEKFAEQNISGKGIKIAVLDNGFSHADIHPAFSHIIKRNGILKIRNFNTGDTMVYNSKDPHGTMVLSCIAGRYRDKQMGLAPDADFLLAIVGRNNGNVNSDDDNWVAAFEWADKEGAQIISSSLEYIYPDYIDMIHNNEISIETYTANLAAKKGILVVVAAGNEGVTGIKYIGPPADADSALTVGAVRPETGTHVPTSSFGPNYHWGIKPNLTASGHDLVALGKDVYKGERGTSFAAPLVTGFAACVWQMHPKWTNMQLFDSLQKSGNLYPYYDYANGYGIPQAGYFCHSTRDTVKPTFEISISKSDHDLKLPEREYVQVILSPLYTDKYNLHKINAGKTKHKYLYYHFEDAAGVIKRYYVLKPKKSVPVSFQIKPEMQGAYLVVFYDGYMQKIKL